MIAENEVLLKSGEGWLYFSSPHTVIATEAIEEVQSSLKEAERLVHLNGWFAAGFVSYEAAPGFDVNLRTLKTEKFPLIWLGLYSQPQTVNLPLSTSPLEAHTWRTTVERNVYNTAIQKIKANIAEGKTYQVNYTMRLQTEFPGKTWNFFLQLAQNQNRYAAYVNTEHYVICSASPELFFHLDGETITCRPMKGTAPRGRSAAEDQEQTAWLQNSEKNRAENVMIVDMIRNDLGKIAKVGSVQTPRLFEIETYPTLLQMTSTVQAKTKASVTEIFQALFPCASITGAPKVSTQRIISELETTPRKIYTGSIGYLGPNRQAQFNVAIRTALIDKERQLAEYGVGGGIVWDSESGAEYDEALLKAEALTKQSPQFSLLETLLWTPSEGYFLLDKHFARMADSAQYFGFPFRADKLTNLLNEAEIKFTIPQRLRILLNRLGEFKIEAHGFAREERKLRAGLASAPINSTSPFYFHKTTHREFYPQLSGVDDILLFNEKSELTEFTIGNLVVRINGRLFTPPTACGLLAGTFRAHLLETGQVEIRSVTIDELESCEEIFRVNSVRKWERVEIIQKVSIRGH